MEAVTNFMIEVTYHEKHLPERRLPFRAADKAALTQRIKDMLNADDVHIYHLKEFELDEKEPEDGENQD